MKPPNQLAEDLDRLNRWHDAIAAMGQPSSIEYADAGDPSDDLSGSTQ